MGVVLLVIAWLTGPALCLAVVTSLVSDPQFERLARLRSAVRARLLRGKQDTRPGGRPIEQIAADARRFGHQLRRADDGRSQARINALRLAYDHVLAEGCAAFDVPELLGVLEDGPELDLERRRVEVVLTGVGMVLEDVY
jgi:hypothetical protein